MLPINMETAPFKGNDCDTNHVKHETYTICIGGRMNYLARRLSDDFSLVKYLTYSVRFSRRMDCQWVSTVDSGPTDDRLLIVKLIEDRFQKYSFTVKSIEQGNVRNLNDIIIEVFTIISSRWKLIGADLIEIDRDITLVDMLVRAELSYFNSRVSLDSRINESASCSSLFTQFCDFLGQAIYSRGVSLNYQVQFQVLLKEFTEIRAQNVLFQEQLIALKSQNSVLDSELVRFRGIVDQYSQELNDVSVFPSVQLQKNDDPYVSSEIAQCSVCCVVLVSGKNASLRQVKRQIKCLDGKCYECVRKIVSQKQVETSVTFESKKIRVSSQIELKSIVKNEFECVCLKLKTAVYCLSVFDLEYSPVSNNITQFGVVTMNVDLDILTEKHYSVSTKIKYNYGLTIIVDSKRLLQIISNYCSIANMWVAWSSSDFYVLKKNSIMLTNWVDCQRLAILLPGAKNDHMSLKVMGQKIGILDGYHNAGNDAHVTALLFRQLFSLKD